MRRGKSGDGEGDWGWGLAAASIAGNVIQKIERDSVANQRDQYFAAYESEVASHALTAQQRDGLLVERRDLRNQLENERRDKQNLRTEMAAKDREIHQLREQLRQRPG